MKFGVSLNNVRATKRAEIAQHAESLGFESVWIPDHLVLPVGYTSPHPYSSDGSAPIIHHAPLSDPLMGLVHIAARTTTIKLGTAVYVLPLRSPLVTAKAVATLDVLSEGRALFGVGIGWLREEFEAVGVEWRRRGPRSEEYIRVLRTLWTDDEPAFDGEFVSFAPLHFDPKPVQKPGPPILIGGETPVALARAARVGDGWIGVATTPESAAARAATLLELRRQFGRDHLPFPMIVSWHDPSLDDVRRFEEAGVHTLVVSPFRGYSTAVDGLERFAETTRMNAGASF